MGSPPEDLPHGVLMAGRPARLGGSVKMSARYISSGSLVFSPSANAGVGVYLDYEVINNRLMVSASGTAVTVA